jgi:excinuclease ABC subunit B
VETIERMEIIRDLRLGVIDVLVGINLLREGLDIPECSLVAILDADKQGFLRSETSLIQTIGRAARNASVRYIMYGDTITAAMRVAIDETNRRRKIQNEYNLKHNITPTTIQKGVSDILQISKKEDVLAATKNMSKNQKQELIKQLNTEMRQAAKLLEFEYAHGLEIK